MASLRRQVEERRAALAADRRDFEPVWRDLAKHFVPRRFRSLYDEGERGQLQNQTLYNNVGVISAQRMRAGLFAGASSSSQPWFALTTADPDMAEYGPVKEHLFVRERRLYEIFQLSNTYNRLPEAYHVCPIFGTAAILWLQDDRDILRGIHLEPGSYYIAQDENGRVDTLYRDFTMSVRNLIRRFGQENVSPTVRRLTGRGKDIDTRIRVCQAIEPRRDREPGKLNARNKPWRSVYWELGLDADRVLDEGGFDLFPATVPRWSTVGDDVWGYGAAWDCLGDAQSVQVLEERIIEGIEKQVRPPVMGPTGLDDVALDTSPGAVNALEFDTAGLKPVYAVSPNLRDAREQVREYEARVERALMVDLMLMLSSRRGGQPPTAEQIAREYQEKVMVLGPNLEQLHEGLLKPLIDVADYLAEASGLVPPPPPELTRVRVPVRFISTLASAQRLVGATSLDQYFLSLGQLAAFDQKVRDKADTDQAADQYAEIYGVPPKINRTDDQVAQIRDARSRQEQVAALAAAAPAAAQAANAAKSLADTAVTRGSLLERALSRMGAV